MVSILVADDFETLGAKTLAAMVLMYSSQDISVSTPKGWQILIKTKCLKS